MGTSTCAATASQIAARGKDNSFATYHEPTVQLRQFLNGSAEIEIGDMSRSPNNGSKINALDLASTAFSSPSVNRVPTRLPSRLSRAISTASPIRDSRASGSYSVTWQRMLSNIHQLRASGRGPPAHRGHALSLD